MKVNRPTEAQKEYVRSVLPNADLMQLAAQSNNKLSSVKTIQGKTFCKFNGEQCRLSEAAKLLRELFE